MVRRWWVWLGVVALTLGFTQSASAETTIKLGTLAPKDSAWGTVFKAWAKAVDDESKGSLKLDWFYGNAGDEAQMVQAMRNNGLDGAALTATGLSMIYPHIVALQLPGLFPTWAKLDAARDATRPLFEKEFEAQGFRLLGTGDVGIAHIMSRGGPVRVPDDLAKKFHPFYVSGDPIGEKFLQTIGITSPRPLSVPAILPALQSRSPGAFDVINVPAIAAAQLQWAPNVDHINTMTSGIGIGALVMKKDRVDQLPADARALLERTGKNTGKVLSQRIRKIDSDTFESLKKKMTVVTPTADELAKWDAVFAKVRASLRAENKIKPDVFDAVVAAAK